MTLNKTHWEWYKESVQGQTAIESFSNREDFMDDVRLLERYNPKICGGFDAEAICYCLESVWCYKISEYEDVNSLDAAALIYEEIISTGFMVESDIIYKAGDYENMLTLVQYISLGLSYRLSEYFFPYLYINEFYHLQKLADYFEIELPQIPKKPDYKGRCMYYWELCKVFYNFRIENDLTSQELWAFMYDYAPTCFNEEENTDMPKPSSAWFVGGRIEGYGDKWTTGFWQSNKDTKRGDILIHYETSPISAITCLWIAQTDGVIDPFFHYYSNTYIGDRIDIPHITLKELQQNEYFSNHPLVRKNFQGVNGWALTGEDYSELLRMIKAKCGDISVLPKIYVPSMPKGVIIERERDVERQLLEPLLNSMGWHEGVNFKRQMPIRAGRGHRVFLDYALHYDDKYDEEKAKVLIEAKLHMKNNQDVEQAFLQAFSYAKLLESSVIVLCDKSCLIVYEKGKGFSRSRYAKYGWGDMGNPDIYKELKNKLK